MKAKELRIGNFLRTPNGINHVSGIQDREVVEVGEIGYVIEMVKPIPLTEEWLEKFGFETYTTEKSKVYKLGNFMVTYVLKGRFAGNKYLKAFNISFSEFGHIEHVHTLQNLYFALTGEELQIKK